MKSKAGRNGNGRSAGQPAAREQPRAQPQQQQPARPDRPQQQQQQRPQQQQQRPQYRERPEPARRQQEFRQPVPQRSRQQAASWQQQRGWAQSGAWQGHTSWQQGRAQRWESDHRGWDQRGGYGGYYIPQASFSLSFGDRHSFRIRSRPVMYMGYPRFSYGGYSFLLVDPWPESWGENWYDTDDVYIDYDDGYYLYNRNYPYIRMAITVAL